MTVAHSRPAWIEVDLAAIAANAGALAELAAPARLCAVVKADGYGHGAARVAEASLAGGASSLSVALVEEGLELRDAGVEAEILVLADAPREACGEAVAAGLTPTVSSTASIDAVAAAAGGRRLGVHLKVDTGMHRVGCAPEDAVRRAQEIRAADLALAAVWTHLACADDSLQDSVTASQLDCFDEVLSSMGSAGVAPSSAHAANSAGAIHHPRSRFDLVRCGIALYGYAPSPSRPLPASLVLRPALGLKARVTAVREVPAGDGVSYGWTRRTGGSRHVATIPLGYADGIPRVLGETGAEVLIRGVRCPMAGRVTMDQSMVECGSDVVVGDEVVLLGAQGGELVTADEWARLSGTISYEILARLGSRIPRRYV